MSRSPVPSSLLACSLIAIASHAYASPPSQITVMNGGAASLGNDTAGADGLQAVELDPATFGNDADSGGDDDSSGGAIINRSITQGSGPGAAVKARARAKANPELLASFDGINFRQQRLANNGNQFSIEPPDQGLCAGNGYVIESVNAVMRIHDASGATLRTVDLNTFYGYAPALDRAHGNKFGPELTDPSCLFDPDTQRWFHVTLTLDRVGTTSALAGTNHLDLAVSNSADPLGSWTIYSIPVQNDGTAGTPFHGCAGGPCLGDYPHMGADHYGIYITTNEFSLFGPGFHGAQIYALSKHVLAAGSFSLTAYLFDTGDGTAAPDGFPGFTVWPAQTPDGIGSDVGALFLSSDAVFSDTRASSRVREWVLTGASTIDSAAPSLALTSSYIAVAAYGVPPKANQKAGDFPLGQCLSDTVTNCWQFFLPAPAPVQPLERLDANDSRMQQVFYANGKLWAALDTALQINGVTQAGIEYFVIDPASAKLTLAGYVAVAGNNATYPAVAVTSSGRGVIAFTLVGNDHYPSAAYVSLDAKVGAGDVHVAAEGAGPEDGFAAYRPLSGTTRQRWGDYGAAAVDGNTLWIASEYIGQTCTLSQFIATGFSCGGTRASFGNWDTRISKLSGN